MLEWHISKEPCELFMTPHTTLEGLSLQQLHLDLETTPGQYIFSSSFRGCRSLHWNGLHDTQDSQLGAKNLQWLFLITEYSSWAQVTDKEPGNDSWNPCQFPMVIWILSLACRLLNLQFSIIGQGGRGGFKRHQSPTIMWYSGDIIKTISSPCRHSNQHRSSSSVGSCDNDYVHGQCQLFLTHASPGCQHWASQFSHRIHGYNPLRDGTNI